MADVWITEGGRYSKGVWHGLPYKGNAAGKYITSEYGAYEDFRRERGWAPHQGVDIGATPIGTPLYAMEDCTISFAGRSTMFPVAGEYVRMEHTDGYDVAYLHLSEINVSVGDIAPKGGLIGLSGNTSSVATDPHLHITVRDGNTVVDPIPYLTRGAEPQLDKETVQEWFVSEYFLSRASHGGTKSQEAPRFVGYAPDEKSEVWEIRLLRPGNERPE